MSKKSTDIGVGKKVLASALSAAMVVAFAPAVAMADTNTDNNDIPVVHTVEGAVAQVGDQQYASVDDALSSWAVQGGTLKLVDDCTSTKTVEIGQGLNCSLDLAGHTLSMDWTGGSAPWFGIKVYGTLTVLDSDSVGNGLIDFKNQYAAALNAFDNGIINIESGSIQANSGAAAAAINMNNNSLLKMTGGHLKTTNSSKKYSLYLRNNSSAEIQRGTVAFVTMYNTSQLTVGSQGGKVDEVSVGAVSAGSGRKVTLKNGTIKSCSGNSASWIFTASDELLFENDPSSLLPSGLTVKPVERNGSQYYRVVDSTQENAEAYLLKENGTTGSYGTVQQAADAMSEGDTLVLKKDVEIANAISIKVANIAVDLNGHNILSRGKYQPGLKFDIISQSDDYQTLRNVKIIDNSPNGGGSVKAYRPISALASNCVVDVVVDPKVTLTVDDNGLAVSLLRGARMKKTDENLKLAVSGNGENALWAASTSQGDYLYGGASLKELASTASDGKATLLTDWDDIATLSYYESKDLALDLNGHTITHMGSNPAIVASQKMAGRLLLENGTIDARGSSASCVVQLVAENANINFENVTLKGKTAGIAGNGSLSGATNSSAGSKVSIKGGAIEVDDGIGIYWPVRDGVLSLDNVKIDAHTGVQVCSGSLALMGSTMISAKGMPQQKTENDGAILDGSAISVVSREGYGEITNISVEDGVFSSASAQAVKAYSWNNADKGEGVFDNAGNKIQITGGTFSSDPSTYLASGYVVSGSGPYTVSKYVPAPVTPVDPTPTPTPEPAAPGTNVSGTDSAGNTVEATVTDNNKTTLPDGTEAAGSVEYKGTTSGSGSGQPASEAAIPSTVTANGSTYVVTKIADEAFEGQEQLTKVTIPETVVEIGSKAFANTSISSVVIPAATTTIGAGVFQGCDDLESVDISKAALTSIPEDAFNGTAISSISISKTVKSVGARAFKGTALKSVELPAATTTLGTAAFQGCASLKSADISKAALTEIPAYAFNGASITSIEIPDTVKTIGKRAFKKTKLKTVSTDVEALGRGAFSGCASLKSATLPEVAEIGECAFYGNEALKTLTTGADLEAIGPKAFKGAGKFKVLRINSKRLTKSGVKGSLKGSAVTKVEVAVTGSKKTQDKYVKRYSKFFAKANSGKSVEVTKAKKASKK